MAADERAIHHVVHGYDKGHRLLATSMSLPDDVSAIVNRTSDAVPNYRPSTGPYLTGYGLPDGSYAFARTWPEPEAQRPNTVWTHTLVIPSTLVGRVTASAVVQQLRHPREATDLSFYSEPVPVETLTRTFTAVTAADAVAGMAIYQRDAVVLPAKEADSRERLALALWDQQWIPVRRTYNFCTAVDASPFDRNCRLLLFSSQQASESPTRHTVEATSWQVVIADLRDPTEFREWLHFVGSGERDYRLITTFADVYLLLGGAVGADRGIHRAQQILLQAGPDVGELRRLKRRLLSFDGATPMWAVEPGALFHALASEPLGNMVAADDASLEHWIPYAWQMEPDAIASLLAEESTTRPDDDRADDNRPDEVELGGIRIRVPARDALRAASRNAFADLLTPSTLAVAAEAVPDRVVEVLLKRDDRELWRAWANLKAPIRKLTLAGMERPADWSIAIDSIRDKPAAVRDLLAARPGAIAALIDEVSKHPHPADPDLHPLPPAAARVVRREIESGRNPDRIRAVSHLATPSDLPKNVNWVAWIDEVDHNADEVVAAIAYLIGRRADSDKGRRLAAAALAVLYPELAKGRAKHAWSRLTDQITGDRRDSDRGGRLVDDLAKAVAKLGESSAAALVDFLRTRNPAAASALAANLDRTRSKSRRGLFRW